MGRRHERAAFALRSGICEGAENIRQRPGILCHSKPLRWALFLFSLAFLPAGHKKNALSKPRAFLENKFTLSAKRDQLAVTFERPARTCQPHQ